MYLTKTTILLISEDTPLHQWFVLGFSALLLVALVYFLIRKLKSLQADYYADGETDESLPGAAASPENIFFNGHKNPTAVNSGTLSSPKDRAQGARTSTGFEEKKPTLIFNQPLPELPSINKKLTFDNPLPWPSPADKQPANVPSVNGTASVKNTMPAADKTPPAHGQNAADYAADNHQPVFNRPPAGLPQTPPVSSDEPTQKISSAIPTESTDNPTVQLPPVDVPVPAVPDTPKPEAPKTEPVFAHSVPANLPATAATSASTDNSGHDAINAILNSLTDIIFEFDENKVCLNVWYNKTRAMLVDLDTFKGQTISKSIGEDKAAEINKAIDHVIQHRQSTTVEFRSFFGSVRWFSAKISPVFNETGEYIHRMTASVSDISEQKKYSAALKENQYQLIEAQRIAKMGNWWYDIELKQTYWSDNLFALLNTTALPPGLSHFEYYARIVHPEDRRLVYQFFANMTGSNHAELEHRIITDTGAPRYFLIVRGGIFKNKAGTITRVTGIIKDVTESRRHERTLKKSQAELLEAQTIAKIGNWKWHFGQKTLQWSDEVYHIYEVEKPAKQLNDKSHFKLLLRYVHPDDRHILLSFLKDPVNRKHTSYEYRIITPGGHVKYLSIIIGKIKRNEDGSVRNVLGTLQDITDRKTAELNIQKTEDSYQMVLEAIKLAAIATDHEGRIIFCNKYLAALLGYEQSELIGLNWYQTFVPQNLKTVFKDWYENNDIKSNYVNPVICRNGEQRIISWQNTTTYDEQGRIKRTTSIGEDITDQQKDRQQLISAKEEAERASLFKSDFLSTMSHEIRTPMNAVIGTTNLLLEENPRPDQLSYLQNLKFSGETLLGIINDILDYNKIEAGKFELSKVPLNIHDLMSNIKQSFQPRATEKSLNLLMETDLGIPKGLRGDPIRLGQILNNLIGNAIKFTEQGNVLVQTREVSRTDNRITLQFMIADTGIGIAPKNLGRIFEPFVQENQQEHFGGSGLGLAIVKRLLELHGSQIEVASTLGKGTQFTFSITFDYALLAPATQVAPAATVEQKTAGNNLSGMRILVVDDNKMNILIANRFLNKWNASTQEASNGAIAVDMVKKNDYDLIIMDLQMPIMDGFEATQIIKSSHPQLPIIALTADAMPETYTRASGLGMDDFLTKPFMPEVLFEKVSRFYKNKPSVGTDSLDRI